MSEDIAFDLNKSETELTAEELLFKFAYNKDETSRNYLALEEVVMADKNLPFDYINVDLEIEAIQRFRSLVPFLSPDCLVFRELEGNYTILCLDFTACPQELAMTAPERLEWAELLLYSSHYLGLASTLVFKIGDRILGKINLKQFVTPRD